MASHPATMSPAAPNPIPTLLDFVSSVPAPLTTVLVGLSPWIARLRSFAEIVSWKASWDRSWLLLATWWAACLLSPLLLKYLLPFAVLAFVALQRWRRQSNPPMPLPVASEQTLQAVIADMTTIHALLPSCSTCAPTSSTPLPVLLRVTLILFVPWVILTHLIHLRIIVALSGTLLFAHRAPWAARLRHTLLTSAHLRWAAYKAWSLLSGTPLAPPELSPQSRTLSALSVSDQRTAPEPPPVRFLFTVYENQRWWMGLDWTAALLPGERPSWCSAPPALAPMAPPASFALPPPTTVYMPLPPPTTVYMPLPPAPAAKSKSTATKRVKRTATWRWAEPEWRLSIRAEGRTARVERHPPEDEGESKSKLGLVRAATKVNWAGHGRTPSAEEEVKRGLEMERIQQERESGKEGAEKEGSGHHSEVDEPATDTDGWVYGDNKWEGASMKGGLGKYTRYRRWTRIAVLTEHVEIVDESEVPPPPAPPGSPVRARPPLPALATHSAAASIVGQPSITTSPTQVTASPEKDKDKELGLRQRLKAAVKNVGSPGS